MAAVATIIALMGLVARRPASRCVVNQNAMSGVAACCARATVEHVHVHEGGQAIVGNVETQGVGCYPSRRINLMQSKSAMHQSPRCQARTRRGTECQSPAMPNGRCRMHGGRSPGAPKGNRNAWKHGRYSAEAIARRRSIAELIRQARELMR